MKNIFIDSDVILDVLTERKPFYSESRKLFDVIEKKLISAYTSTLIIANLHYIICKAKSKKTADTTIQKLITIIRIVAFKEEDIINSINSRFNDFEDGIQNYAAARNNMECLITRNVKDYKHANLPIYSPEEILQITEETTL
jgi:predicted nucleic acid-binding protein